MPKHDPLVILVHIEQAVSRLLRWMEGVSREAFLADDLRQAAVIRQLEIIGEATGRLPSAFLKAHADALPWRAMKGMRNVLIHGYDDVDVDLVWRTVTEDIPRMLTPLHRLLAAASHASADRPENSPPSSPIR